MQTNLDVTWYAISYISLDSRYGLNCILKKDLINTGILDCVYLNLFILYFVLYLGSRFSGKVVKLGSQNISPSEHNTGSDVCCSL